MEVTYRRKIADLKGPIFIAGNRGALFTPKLNLNDGECIDGDQ